MLTHRHRDCDTAVIFLMGLGASGQWIEQECLLALFDHEPNLDARLSASTVLAHLDEHGWIRYQNTFVRITAAGRRRACTVYADTSIPLLDQFTRIDLGAA